MTYLSAKRDSEIDARRRAAGKTTDDVDMVIRRGERKGLGEHAIEFTGMKPGETQTARDPRRVVIGARIDAELAMMPAS